MAKRMTASDIIGQNQNRASQILSDAGLDWWTRKKYALDQDMKSMDSYLNSGSMNSRENQQFFDTAKRNYDSLDREMASYGAGSTRYKQLSGYRDYYQNAFTQIRQNDLQSGMDRYGKYLSDGQYTVEGNQDHRARAEKAISDLTEEMKQYGTNTDYYKMLSAYRDYYQDSIKTLDRTEAAASANDYISADSWHSQEDYAAQKSMVESSIALLEDELKKIKDPYSDEYKATKAYLDYYNGLLEGLDSRNQLDSYFNSADEYVAWTKRNDYDYYANLAAQIDQLQRREAERSAEYRDNMFAPHSADALNALTAEGRENTRQLAALLEERDRLQRYQTNSILADNYGYFDIHTDYEKIVDDLKDELRKTEKGTADYYEIEAKIRALAGENRDGRDDEGNFDESTYLGRSIAFNYDADAARDRIKEIDKELKEIDNGKDKNVGHADGLYEDNDSRKERAEELRQEKRNLERDINLSDRSAVRSIFEYDYNSAPEEQREKYIAAGREAMQESGHYGRFTGYDGTKVSVYGFTDLDDENGGYIRDMILYALGAEQLGKDLGYTAGQVYKAFEEDINQVAGIKMAEDIENMSGLKKKWNQNVLMPLAAAGAQIGKGFSTTGDYLPTTAGEVANAALDESRSTGEHYLASAITTITNMMPSIAASTAVSALTGGLGAPAAIAKTAGSVVGAATIGYSSGKNSYNEMVGKGWSKEDARIYGAIMGGAEAGMQYVLGGITKFGGIGEEKLLSAVARMSNAAGRVATSTGVHVLFETGEELLQNKLESYLQYKMFNGDEDWLAWTEEDWETVIVTAITTGVMEGPGEIHTEISNARLGKQLTGATPAISEKEAKAMKSRVDAGKDFTKSQERKLIISKVGEVMKGNEALTEALIVVGKDQGEGTTAYGIASRMESGKYAKTAANYGNLFNAILEESKDPNKTMAALIGGGIRYNELIKTQKQLDAARNDESAANEQLAAVKAKNPGATVLSRTATKIQQLGGDPVASVDTAAVINKVRNGQAISSREMSELTGNTSEAKAARLYLAQMTGDANFNADADPAVTEALVDKLIETNREQKKAEAAQMDAAVLAAAKDAAASYETQRVTASDAAELKKAKTGVELAKAKREVAEQRVEAVKGASPNEMAEAETADQLMLNRLMHDREVIRAQIEGLENKNGSVMRPKAQALRLAELRKQLNDIDLQIKKAKYTVLSEREAEAKKAEAEKAKAEKAKTEDKKEKPKGKPTIPPKSTPKAETKSAPNDSDTVTIPGTDFTQTRGAYVKAMTTGENAISVEEANRRFDDMLAQTGKKGTVTNEQTADQDKGRSDLGGRPDGGADQERTARSEEGSDTGRDRGRRKLSTFNGSREVDIDEEVDADATITHSDDLSALEETHTNIRAFTDKLLQAGFKRVTYITNGRLYNAAGEAVPGMYNSGELFLALDPVPGWAGPVATAEHEKTHLKLDLYRASFNEENGPDEGDAFVSAALQNILGKDRYVDAFRAYWKRYAPNYLKKNNLDTVAHMVNEEMLCDMMGGINNFGTDLGEFQVDAKDILDASGFDTATTSIAANLNPGPVSVEAVDPGAMPHNIPVDTLLSTENVDSPSTGVASIQSVSRDAKYGFGRAMGFSIDGENDVWYMSPEDAKARINGFKEVTPEQIANSPLGELIEYAKDKKYISEESMRRQLQLFADLGTICEKTADLYSAMQFYGSVLFTAMKLNSDKQYGLSEDIANICTKTQAMIDGMSEEMKRVKRGLSDEEILEIYQKRVTAGLPVNCPECYVFSRWIGIGGLLDNIYSYQEKFSKMSVEEVAAEYDTLFEEVITKFKNDRAAFINKAIANGMSPEEAEAEAKKKFSKGKSRSKLVKETEKRYNDLLDKQEKLLAEGKDLSQKEATELKELEGKALSLRALVWINNVYFGGKNSHTAADVNPRFAVPSDILFDLNAGEDFALHYPEAWAFRTTQGAGYGKAIVPTAEANLGESIMVTMNSGYIKKRAEAARKYQGDDVDERHRAADAFNIFLNQRGRIVDEKNKKGSRSDVLTKTTKKNLNQLFLGGQRLQSTSDSRFDTAIDTLMIMTELQAMHGGAQIYTKVLGAVPFYDAVGGFVNMSAMPFGGGFRLVDGKPVGDPLDTSVGGVNMEQAIALREQCPHAGTITIGVNDAHIRAMFKQIFRDFIIPYHASGGKIAIVAEMRRIQEGIKEKGYKMPQSTDYTLTQTDKFLSDTILKNDLGYSQEQIDEIHRYRDMRIWLLTNGKKGVQHMDLTRTDAPNLTPAQKNARTIFQQLYASTRTPGAKWYGLELAKGVIDGQIFPNEFWNTKATYDGRNNTEHSSVNTQRYLDYCEALGVLHRFSGKGVKTGKAPTIDGGMVMRGHIYNVNGRDPAGNEVALTDLAYQVDENGNYLLDEYGNRIIEPYFWKTLTDHRMYGNEGEYLEQGAVTLDGLLGLDNPNAEEAVAQSAETFASKEEGFAHPTGEVRYNLKKSMRLASEPLERNRAQSRLSIQEEVPVDDVKSVGNTLVVEIDSKKSGLRNFPKGRWASLLQSQIKRELVGKTILTDDGDLITFMDRSAGEPTWGKAAREDFDEARETGDFSKVNQKQLTLDHLASLVSTSKFGRWAENDDPSDDFKKDGLNHRDAMIKIDGQYYDVDIATALNLDETDPENYGDKFYDIKISEAPSTKMYGAPQSRTNPYKIRFVENTSDRLSVAQKNRAVKNAGLKFTAEKSGGTTAARNAFANAGKIRTKQSRYALAMTDPSYETSKREAPVTDERGQVLFVEPSSDAWAVARDTDGSLLNTDYIKNVLGLDIYDNPKDEHVVEERGSAGGGVGHLTAVTSTVPSYRQAFQYLKDKFPNAQNMRVLDASSGQGLGTAYGRDPAAAGKEAEKKAVAARKAHDDYQRKILGKILSDTESDKLSGLWGAVKKAKNSKDVWQLAAAKDALTKYENEVLGKTLSDKELDKVSSNWSATKNSEAVLAEIHKLAGPDFDKSDVSFNVTDLEPYNDPSHKVDFKKYGGLIAAIDAGEEEPFDFVISNAVMNVIAQDAREELMAALLRMTRPGGQIFINPADTGASSGALTLKQFHDAKDAGQDVSDKKVLLVPGVGNIGPETYVAKTKTIQKAFKPKEFQAFAKDVAKQALGEDIEIVAGGTEGTGAINKGFIITRPKTDQNGPSRFSIQLTPEQQRNRDLNNQQTDTGSGLWTLNSGGKKSDAMTRSTAKLDGVPANVGKQMGDQIYVHKNYADRVVPKDILDHALKVLSYYPGFKYNTIMYDRKTKEVRFDEAPNFDTAREPIPGRMLKVKPDKDVGEADYSEYIWHHKWMWVDNDYKGFGEDGVRKSWEWSRQWLNELRPVDPSEDVFSSKGSYNGKANGSGNGPGYFHEQLEYFGLPTDPASEIEHKNKAEEKAAINAMYTGPEKSRPVIPAKNAPKKQAAKTESAPKSQPRYSIQGEPATRQQAQSYYSQQDQQINDWAPEFYSKMQRTIEDWTGNNGKPMGAKMGANQVLGWLKGKGVKAEEIKWSGIVPYLEGKKSVTKDELLAVMAENEIKIETKVLGGENNKYRFWSDRDFEEVEADGFEGLLEAAQWIAEEDGWDPELINIRPSYDGGATVTRTDTGEIIIDAVPSNGDTHWSEYKLNNIGGYNYREILFKMPELNYSNRAMQVHWGNREEYNGGPDAQNIIAHARVQDTLTGGWIGTPTIFVEEIQSDLHNAGVSRPGPKNEVGLTREHAPAGFAATKAQREYQELSEILNHRDFTEEEERRHEKLLTQFDTSGLEKARRNYLAAIENRKPYEATAEEITSAIEADPMVQELKHFYGRLRHRDIVEWVTGMTRRGDSFDPNAPADVVLDQLRAEERQDASAKIMDEAVPEDMRTKLEEVRAAYRAVADASEDLVVANRSLATAPPDVPFAGSSDTYHEYVMKHLLRLAAEGGYDRLAWTTAQQQSDRWSDEYAEGYKIEYDQNIPKFMNKYVKQWGGKVGTTTLDNGDEVWSVDITPEMRDSVLHEGQPRFSIQDSTPSTSRYAESQLDKDIFDLVSTKGPEALGAQVDEWLAKHEDALEAAKIQAPSIPSKGFVPKSTAREQDAFKKEIDRLIGLYGHQKPSEKSNGFVIPAKNDKGKAFRRHYQNVGSAENLPADAHDLTVRQLMTSTRSSYVQVSNKERLETAKNDIADLGYGPAMAVFNKDAKRLKMSIKDMAQTIALGEQLMLEAAAQGDAANFMETLATVSELLTTNGQSLQAARLLKQSGPMGQLYYADRVVKRLNSMFEDDIKKGKAPKIVVDPDLAQAVIQAKTAEEREAAMNELKANIAEQCPNTFRDKWNAWRYLSMLGNVRTHIRNVIGNAVFSPLRFVKDLMTAGGEYLAVKKGWMDEKDRRKAVHVSRELREFALKDADLLRQELQGTGKYNPAQEILNMRKLLPGPLDTLSRINSEGIGEGHGLLSKVLIGLEGEDWLFLRPAYAKALAMQLSHSGLSVDEMYLEENQRTLNEARQNAILEAQKATYRDFSAVAAWLNRGKQIRGRGSIAAIGLEGVLPFTKTPINILKRGVEYSPIGLAKGIVTILSGLKNGNLDMAEALDQISAGLTGMGVAALGLLLARMGWLRGKKSDDDEENFDKLQGYQDYAIQIGDLSLTIDWAAPSALPLFTGAAISQLLDESDGEFELKDIWNGIMMIAEPMTSLSMLDGLNKLIDSTSYASGNEKLATIATQAATSYFGQAFPTILGQVARTIDGTRRATYIDKNSPVPAAMQRFVQTSVQNKIPVWESSKVPYIDAWGRQSEAGSKVLNGLENFFAPWYSSVKNVTDVDEELQDLYSKTKADILPSAPKKYFSVGGVDKYLTADEWTSFATDVGQTKYSLLTSLISDPRYLALSDEEKAIAVGEIYTYATTAGKFHIEPTYDIHRQGIWIEDAEAAATDFARFEIIWEHIMHKLSS